MLLCAWFVNLKLREAVLETWSLTHSINIYTYSQGMQLQEPQFSDWLGISPKLIHLTLCLWQKNPGFRKNSLCSLIWPDFDSFESANSPLKSTQTFECDGKFVSAYDLHKLPTQRHLRNAVLDANLNSRVPSGLFGTRACCHASQRNNIVIKLN